MNLIQTIILAIVEGITEFLPVSSTGHMIIAQKLLSIESTEFVKAFTVNIQFGAILSVVVLYWKRFFQSLDFYWKLIVAVIPALVLGFLFSDKIDSLLENVEVVAIMLVLGGILMLFVDKWFNKPNDDQTMDWKRALKVGFFQCIAMIPGVSRSMASIVGGMTTKLTRKNAAEFSFFLAVPTMAAASGYKLLKLFMDPAGKSMLSENLVTLLVGNLVAFVVAMIAIKFFIGFLTKYGFKAFGYYRIIVGVAILVLLFLGVDLNIL
ncbi:Undecaprenyl-diphosphatase [Paludibacter propionicigenes WB4]|uniref:Undecaprenyl-diphosphatase n=1 Tax=Paludibacter propionicigenes (strain DSM 17365 / JCM 13257 / WB4) TaxID=694427 RepID=E4T3U6_PALPW|nr:undecaprenyl-diphosphate phosphatase [Paludibacter propionicigenes]ADQ79390.1 Undecaprenyl-diphosphatase [Paludibacter propionicigenes WB4]